MKKSTKKKPKYFGRPAIKNCGGKKCGSAFEWKVSDITKQFKATA